MEKTFLQRFSNLKTEVIDNIRKLVDEKIEFVDKPTFTDFNSDDGVCGLVVVDYIYKKDDDIFVVGNNDQTDEEVEYSIIEIELLEVININNALVNFRIN